MPQLRLDGLDLHWQRLGQGPRRAVAAHCSLGHGGAWGGVAGELDDLLEIRALDLPSHGQSDDWPGGGDIQAATVAALAALAGGPADVIGHSFGATAALRLALERPAIVRSLTLVEPVFFALAFADDAGLRPRYEAEHADYLAAVKAGDMARAARAFGAIWGGLKPFEEMSERVRARMAAQMRVVTEAEPWLHDDPLGLGAPGRIEALAMPVLLVDGAETPIYARRVNDALARRLPAARRLRVPGAGHMVPITHPAPVAGAIRELLAHSDAGTAEAPQS